MTEVSAELPGFFEAPELDLATYDKYSDLVFTSARSRERFDELLSGYAERVDGGAGNPLHLAVGHLMVGGFQQALKWFERAKESKHRDFYSARAAAGLGRLDQALDSYKQAARQGWDAFEIDMLCAALHVRAGDLAAAEKLTKAHERDGADRADWYHARGLIAEEQGERETAAELFQKAITLNPDHEPAMFRRAWLHDLAGEDDEAIKLYERLALKPRAHVNALMNLAVVYEDIGKFEEAVICLRRVLAAYPNHTRARLFLKDVESSRQMVIDDAAEKRTEKRDRLLETPISEFELSVRARNCLKKMNIHSLGDLLKLTEAELLSFKNFGETSLTEIQSLLLKRGLRLGQSPDEIDALTLTEQPQPKVSVPPGMEELLSRPVSEMELSVRARRCLQRLSIGTLGDLIQHTEGDLLATRNFGSTSLDEIKARLTDYGLTLAPKA